MNNSVLRKLEFLSIVSKNTFNLILFNIFWTNFNSNWDTFKLPMVIFPSWIVIISVIIVNSDIWLFNNCLQFFTSFINNLLFSFEWDWNNNSLNLGDSWWKNKTFIVTVLHNHNTNWSGSEAPTCLPNKLLLFLLVFKFNTKHFSEILS